MSSPSSSSLNVVVVGIGAMGGGMARALLLPHPQEKAGDDATTATNCSTSIQTVSGFDLSQEVVRQFHQEAVAAGKGVAQPPTSLSDAISKSTDIVVLSLVNQAQCEQVCFGGEKNLLNLVPKGSCVILTSTVTPSWARTANQRFRAEGILFVDSPISGGPARAKFGDLTMMVSGDEESLTKAKPVVDALGKEIHIIPGGAGFGSTVKCVHQLLAGVHICAAAEAMAMGAKAGLDVSQFYDIVNGAAGASWMFTDRGQRMLTTDDEVKSALDIFVKDLDIVYSEAKSVKAPVPIALAALQQFISGQSLGLGKKDDSQVVKVYETISGVTVASASGRKRSRPAPAVDSSTAVLSKYNIAVIGIGSMGGGMARALLQSPIVTSISGYDKFQTAVEKFYGECQDIGKAPTTPPTTLSEAISGQTNVAILSLVNEMQCDQVCFQGDQSLLSLMPNGSCVILTSTVTASWVKTASQKFEARGIHFVDCPISGGPARALSGDLTMMASGSDESLSMVKPILDVLGQEVHIIDGGPGFGSTVKCVHQLLAGVHICAAAEALSFAAKAGLDTKQFYDIVNGAAGASWMFTDRGQRMLSTDDEAKSALDIFVKDLDIVYSEAKSIKTPVPVALAALQQFISGQSLGLGKKDDSQVVKVYEAISGSKVAPL